MKLCEKKFESACGIDGSSEANAPNSEAASHSSILCLELTAGGSRPVACVKSHFMVLRIGESVGE